MSDYNNVIRAQKGDKEAFSQLIKSHQAQLYRISLSILRSEVECEDSIQETILKAFDSIKTLREPDYFKTWIIRILINECYAILRKKKRVIPTDTWEDYPRVEKDYHHVEIRDAVNKLSNELRTVIVLFYFEDLSIKEISDIVDIPVGTVKTRLHRAKKQLEKSLSSEKGVDIHEQA
ncbi:sigma-70 family RNA polymerase sigma factor [uncultured Metabacillus sp.]|uniref:sigma-70 family RNA polymerase sigma factor n=1 Tax=uncultured Metabacillus sp. TaxID=2860135 RepID=UPI0026366771|nr:sigma-70 family RNA polymerase sigma factor [uncultured Metabacillus sp.]